MRWYFTALRNYAEFSGRAGRAQYWSWLAINLALLTTFQLLAVNFYSLWFLWYTEKDYVGAVFLPTLAVVARRLHDTDRSAWWLLLALAPPIGWVVLWIFAALPGTRGPNRYGPAPAAPARQPAQPELSIG
jgi:uncharacterized membrane protein YhaH (DUF805 family)